MVFLDLDSLIVASLTLTRKLYCNTVGITIEIDVILRHGDMIWREFEQCFHMHSYRVYIY